MERFNAVMGAIKKLLEGEKTVLLRKDHIETFAKCADAFEIPVHGGASHESDDEYWGQTFYVD